MAMHWTLGFDARDPHRLADFWALALGYVAEPGYDEPDGASIVDPHGVGTYNLGTKPLIASSTYARRVHVTSGRTSDHLANIGLR